LELKEALPSPFFSHSYCHSVNLLATPYTAKLAFKVFLWISAVVAVVFGLFFNRLHDAIAHARIDIYVEHLQSVSDSYPSGSKATLLSLRRYFASGPRAEGCQDKQDRETDGPQDACRQM
jgi:hypothetical protein